MSSVNNTNRRKSCFIISCILISILILSSFQFFIKFEELDNESDVENQILPMASISASKHNGESIVRGSFGHDSGDELDDVNHPKVANNARGSEFEEIKYWATFQFDYHNTGITSSSAPATNNTLWKFKCNGEIYSAPIAYNNFVYFTTTDGFLYALNLKTGDEIWSYELGQASYASATVVGDLIFVGSGTETQNNDNKLYCLNAVTGNEVWVENLNGPMIGSPIVLDWPGEEDDNIYFGTLRDNKIYSYNFRTHTKNWEYPIPNGGSGGSDGMWGSLVYYNVGDGWLLFSANSESGNPAENRGLFCINANDGTLRWQFTPDEPNYIIQTYASPTVYLNRVLIGMGLSGSNVLGKLYCLEITTGEELWNFTTGGGSFGYGVTTSPVVVNETIIFGSSDGKMYGLDIDGGFLWEFQTEDTSDGIYSTPAVADDKVFFGSCDNIFYCLDIFNGSLIWSYDLDVDGPKGQYGVSSAPAIAYGRVLVGACNGYLYCFGNKYSSPPVIAIQYPMKNEMLSGQVIINGVSNDDVEVIQVQVKIDDGIWQDAIGNYSWSYTWDTNVVPNGNHIIYARAFDENGFSMANITVLVNNFEGDMLIEVTSHENYQLVAGITNFEGTAVHKFGIITEVQINIDNSTVWEKVNGTSNWYYPWDTSEYEDGEHVVQFRAFDGLNFSKSLVLILNVSNFIDISTPGINPMFRSNKNRNGISDSEVPIASGMFWYYETDNQVEASAVYFGGNIYFGSDDYNIYCLDSDTGAKIWQYETDNQVRSTPMIDNQRLYIGSQDYYIYCLNALSGELIWKYRTNGAVDSSPLIENGIVYFGSYDDKLYALNATNGSLEWVFDTGDEIWGSPAYWNNCIYIGSLNGMVHCVWSNNGTERWNFSASKLTNQNGIYSTPAIVDNKLVIGTEDHFVYCLNTSSGALIWKFETTGFIYSSAAINKGRVYISSLEEENDGVLYALPFNDPNSDGIISADEVIWKFKTHDYDGGSSPIVSTTSGKVLIGSNNASAGGDGKVFCIDEDSGFEDWNFTANGDIHASPTIVKNRVYIGSLDNSMYCIGTIPTKILINITIPITTVVAGDIIAEITFNTFTEEDIPIPRVKLDFEFDKGTLTEGHGTTYHSDTDENGTFVVSYVAPDDLDEETVVTIHVYASLPGYIDNSDSITITITPRLQDDDKSSSDDDIFKELSKSKYYHLIVIALILVIIIIIIFILVIKNRQKLKDLEQGEGPQNKGKDLGPGKNESRISTLPSTSRIPQPIQQQTKYTSTPQPQRLQVPIHSPIAQRSPPTSGTTPTTKMPLKSIFGQEQKSRDPTPVTPPQTAGKTDQNQAPIKK